MNTSTITPSEEKNSMTPFKSLKMENEKLLKYVFSEKMEYNYEIFSSYLNLNTT